MAGSAAIASPPRLGPVRDWIAHYEWFWDDYLRGLQRHPMKGDEK